MRASTGRRGSDTTSPLLLRTVTHGESGQESGRGSDTTSPLLLRTVTHGESGERTRVRPDASDSSWTSHRAYLNAATPPTWLSIDLGLRLAGFASRATFDTFVRLHPKDPERPRLQTAIEDPEERQVFHRPAEPQLDPVNVVKAPADVLGLEPALRTRRRSQQHVFARHVAVVAADRVGLSGAQIARALGLSQQGASAIVNRPASDDIVAAAVSRLESVHKVGRK